MKKIFLLLIFIFCVDSVMALTETDITNDTDVKFKWYREVITDELYYPKKDVLDGYYQDDKNVEYGPYSEWKSEYCNYSEEYYLVETKTIVTYDKLDKIKYVLIANASSTCPTGRCTGAIRVYYDFENLDYEILKDNYFGFLISLPGYYEPEKLLFYIETEHKQVIYLSKNIDIPPIMIASPPSSENIQVVNNNWEARDEAYIRVEANDLDIPLIRNIKDDKVCRVREINTYRYKVEKEYYDDEYYTMVDDYIPDIDNYQVIYTKEFPKSKEVIKNILVPKIEKEYIYSNDIISSECDDNKVIYQNKYIDRFVNKVPRKFYILIVFLGIIIVLLLVKLLSKKRG